MPTTQKLMNMQISDLNPNLPKILGSYGRGMGTPTNIPQRNMDLPNANPQTEIKPPPSHARGFSNYGKSVLDVKQGFFKPDGNQPDLNPGPLKPNNTYNTKNTMGYAKNESDGKINYRPSIGQQNYQKHPSSNSYGFNLGGSKNYAYNSGRENPLPTLDSKQGRKKNDSLGVLETRIKNTELE